MQLILPFAKQKTSVFVWPFETQNKEKVERRWDIAELGEEEFSKITRYEHLTTLNKNFIDKGFKVIMKPNKKIYSFNF